MRRAAKSALVVPALTETRQLLPLVLGGVTLVGVAAGAFMFGIGMQVAGACGSGTLYTAGGGSLRMLVVCWKTPPR